jgi:Trk K+ transport system NAD-binding subunit
VVEELIRLRERVVVVELKADNAFIAACRRMGAPVLIGNATAHETLKAAHIEKARAVIVATNADLVNLEIALLIAEMNEQQRVVVRLGDGILAETARLTAGVKLAVSLPELAAPAFVAGLLGDRVLTMFLVGGEMLAVLELHIAADDLLLNHAVHTLAIDYNSTPVAVHSTGSQQPNTEPNYRLRAGDHLVIIARIPDMDRLTRRVPAPRDWLVEVVAYPLSARETLVLQTRIGRNLSAEDAAHALTQTPFIIASNQTRGHAEELLAVLQREKVTARIRSMRV